jgi:integrase
MAKLTKRFVDALKAQTADYFEWDDELPGFGIRVWPTGRCVYIAQYRAGGRTRRIKIGAHGAITPSEARDAARSILGDVARGEDPAEERDTRRKSLTVEELCDQYLRAADRGLILGKRGGAKKVSTLATDRGRITRHIKPLLGKRLVIDLTAADVNRFISDVTLGKTALVEKTEKKRGKAVVEGGAGTAARTAGLLGGILSFAVAQGTIQTNPAKGVRRPAGKKRQRRLTAGEYRQLGLALVHAKAEAETEQAIDGVWLLALTGCRLGEIVGLRWSEVDEAGGCFRLLDTKEGESVRPIGRAAFEILTGIGRLTDDVFVFSAIRGDGPFGGMRGAWNRIVKRAKLPGVTPHTLRHSFASVAADQGYADTTIATLLGHSLGSVTSRYIHRVDSVLVAAADRVSERVRSLMTTPRTDSLHSSAVSR